MQWVVIEWIREAVVPLVVDAGTMFGDSATKGFILFACRALLALELAL